MIYKIRAYKPDDHTITVDFTHSNRKKKDRIVDFKEMCRRVLTMLMDTGVSGAPVFYLRTDQPIEEVKQQLDDSIQRFFEYLEDWLKEQESTEAS